MPNFLPIVSPEDIAARRLKRATRLVVVSRLIDVTSTNTHQLEIGEDVEHLRRCSTDSSLEERLLTSLHSSRYISGLTHNFYRYPACMSPYLAREVILQFTNRGDLVLDPFMGGGTVIVEALASGRCAVGVDVNPISTFVTNVKTTPMSNRDQDALSLWADAIEMTFESHDNGAIEPRLRNIPPQLLNFYSSVLPRLQELTVKRRKNFIKCALLRVGQWATEGKIKAYDELVLKQKLSMYIAEMFEGLDKFVISASENGVNKNLIPNRSNTVVK